MTARPRTIYIDDALWEELRALAYRQRVTVSEVVRNRLLITTRTPVEVDLEPPAGYSGQRLQTSTTNDVPHSVTVSASPTQPTFTRDIGVSRPAPKPGTKR